MYNRLVVPFSLAHGRLKEVIALSPYGAGVMVFSGIADPEQLAMLTAVVDDHCRVAGIDPAGEERDEIARLVVTLFNNGASSAADLKAALLDRSNQQARRYG